MNTTTETKRPTIEATINESQDILTLTFIDGRELVLDTHNLTPTVLAHATMHGLKQKLVDAAAISRDTETGRAATVNTKFDAVNDVLERLLAGEWNKRREGGAGTSGGLLYRALVRIYDGRKTPEQIKEWLATKSDGDQAAMRKAPNVAKVIDEIRAERATAGDDTVGQGLLDELEGE